MRKLELMKKNICGDIINSQSLPKDKTSVVVVDMVKGFVDIGVFASPRVKAMVPNIVDLLEKFNEYRNVYFRDSHDAECKEFDSYPIHCVRGTEEVEIIDDLVKYIKFKDSIIPKNSTNGFVTEGFKTWLESSIDEWENLIVVGCITEVCVSQFVLTLKAYLNQNNISKNIIVPMNCVDTFDAEGHDAELINVVAFNNMKANGISVVDKIV
ncbi:cysteine hydrolase family protein (plasmid) [Clostridium perfringens]